MHHHGGVNEKVASCEKMALDFFTGRNSAKSLGLIIDIYDEIRHSEIDKKAAKQKFLRVLFNLRKSNSLHSLLEKDDMEDLSLFLGDFLGIVCDEKKCYMNNEFFAKLNVDELYNVLIGTKYLKEKEMVIQKQLSI